MLCLIFWISAKNYKSVQGGHASFGELFKLFFAITFLGMVLSFIFYMVHNNLISEETKSAIVERTIQSQLSISKSLGMSEDQLLTQEDQLHEAMTPESLFGIANTLSSLFLSFFIAIIFASIGALIFKKVPKDL